MNTTRIEARLDTLTDWIGDIRADMARQAEITKQGDPIARREIAKLRDRLTALESTPKQQWQVSAATVVLWVKLALIAGLLLASVPLSRVAGVAGALL
jgi:hypothetical protein